MTGTQRILIVGGGIGGLSAAVSLRTKGFNVHVVEIKADVHASVNGVGIQLPGNALRALDAIGCARAVMENGFCSEFWGRLHDTQGIPIRDIEGARVPGTDFPGLVGILRSVLHQILTDRALHVGARIEYNKTVDSIEQSATDVRVTFNDKTSGVYDVLVGADGVFSKLRKHVYGEDLQLRYSGQSTMRCTIPRQIAGQIEVDRVMLQASEAGMSGCIPIGKDVAYAFCNSTWASDVQRMSDDALRAIMKERLAPYGGLLGYVRDNLINDDTKVVFSPEEYLVAPAPWYNGRVVLLGDAVHAVTPHLGQGASQAIEDGIVLAERLAVNDDVQVAFAEYTERRFERCKLVVESGVQIGDWQQTGVDPKMQALLMQKVTEAMIAPI